MKYAMLTLMMLFSCLTAADGYSCPQSDDWPDLNQWVCDFQSEMTRRDENKSWQRTAELITDSKSIARLRVISTANDEDSCRKYASSATDQMLMRTLTHQALPASFNADRTQFAAAEIWNESASGEVISCESQIFATEGPSRHYTNLYYLKFGTVRAGKHLIIRVNTDWTVDPIH